jgi:hypothetical protein
VSPLVIAALNFMAKREIKKTRITKTNARYRAFKLFETR